MATVIPNALVVGLDPASVIEGGVRIEGDRVTAVGPGVCPSAGDESIDARGAVVLPGLVNGHTHLYAALATGMPAPPRAPTNFHEILRYVWWRLDRALDAESIRTSARIGALDALRCGTTTLIDHHASPECIAGSLDGIEAGLSDVGLRGVLCYEVTERNGRDGVAAGLAENERYAARCAGRRAGRFAAMIGAHAAFTMRDEDLAACAALAHRFGGGVHIHVAEDGCDDAICRATYGGGLLDRLAASGILKIESILGHGTHLTADDLRRVNASNVRVAHNPRSNMNNRVGYAPIDRLARPILLGTDGIGADMFAELRAAWFKACDARVAVPPDRFVAMLAENARAASERLGVRIGALEPGAAADVVVTDYIPASPLTAGSLAGHLIFGLSATHVRTVLVGGQVRLRDRQVVGLDEPGVRREAREIARRMWERLERITLG